jgi:hypothetical protein
MPSCNARLTTIEPIRRCRVSPTIVPSSSSTANACSALGSCNSFCGTIVTDDSGYWPPSPRPARRCIDTSGSIRSNSERTYCCRTAGRTCGPKRRSGFSKGWARRGGLQYWQEFSHGRSGTHFMISSREIGCAGSARGRPVPRPIRRRPTDSFHETGVCGPTLALRTA